MEITIHEKKRAISHFTGNKKGRSRVTKILFTTLFIGVSYKKKHTSLRPCASVQRRNRLRAAEAGKMTSFALNSGDHYVKSLTGFITKSGERSKNFELLEEHIPPLVQRSLGMGQQRSRLNILSVGSGSGEKDVDILKIVKQELQKSEHGRDMKIFNRAIEPNEYSCGLYKAAIGSLPSPLDDQRTEFEICQQRFEEYKESQQESVRFDLVHFIHSIYHVDMEEALLHCFEKELNALGIFVCVVSGHQDLTDALGHVEAEQSVAWKRQG